MTARHKAIKIERIAAKRPTLRLPPSPFIVLRNILLPAITLQFLAFSELFGGAVFIEQIFSYPGLAGLVQEAALKGDVTLLLGIVLISAVWIFVGNLIADILYVVIDPRIKEA